MNFSFTADGSKHFVKQTFILCCVLGAWTSLFANDDSWNDWVPSIEAQHSLCGGYYRVPHDSHHLPQSTIELEADHANYATVGDATLNGHVGIHKGEDAIFANHAKIVRDATGEKIEQIVAEGQVEFSGGDSTHMRSNTLTLDVTESKLYLGPSTYRIYNQAARGKASEISATQHILLLKDAEYTTCAPGNHTWMLKADRIKLDHEKGRGYATHARLEVLDVPVLYTPYFNFPINHDRQTGFLYPTFSQTGQSGGAFAVPFYWNMAPNYDSTVTFDFFSERGLMFETESRFLTHDHNGTLFFNFLPDDQKYRTFLDKSRAENLIPAEGPITGLHGGNNRFYTHLIEKGHLNPNSTIKIDYEYSLDDNYFIDFGKTLEETSKTQLLQTATYHYQGQWWDSKLLVLNYETLHPFDGPLNVDSYRKLPEMNVSATSPVTLYGIESQIKSSLVYFDHPNREEIRGTRFYAQPSVYFPYEELAWSATPRVSVHVLHYFLEDSVNRTTMHIADSPNVIIPQFDLDTKVYFERHMNWFGRALKQTLTPRAYYLYIPYVNQNGLPNFDTAEFDFSFYQLFRPNRFSGGDRINDANQVTLALTTEMFDPNIEAERFHAGIGNTLYFERRRVLLCDPVTGLECNASIDPYLESNHSAYAAFVGYSLTPLWSIQNILEWTPSNETMTKHTTSLQYNREGRRVVNFDYQFTRHDLTDNNSINLAKPELKQTIVSAAWPITLHTVGLGRWNYDYINQRTIETLIGMEIDTCCAAVRFIGQKYLVPNRTGIEDNYSNAYFVQFTLKGLSEFGNLRIDKSLETWVPGFASIH